MTQDIHKIIEFDNNFCKYIRKNQLDEPYIFVFPSNLHQTQIFLNKKTLLLENPGFTYDKNIDFVNLKNELEKIKRNHSKINFKNKKLSDIYFYKIKEIELTINLLKSLGTSEFTKFSKELYGVPSKISTAISILIILINKYFQNSRKTKLLSRKEVIALFESEISNNNFGNWEIIFSKKLLSHAIISKNKRTITIKSKESYTRDEIYNLIQHELFVHATRYINGSESLKIFGLGLPFYEEFEEGLATFAEFSRHRHISTILDAAIKTLAVRFALKHSFIETYVKLNKLLNDSEKSLNYTIRVKRGTDGTRGAYTKDHVYFSGLLKLILTQPKLLLNKNKYKQFLLFKNGFMHLKEYDAILAIYLKFKNLN